MLVRPRKWSKNLCYFREKSGDNLNSGPGLHFARCTLQSAIRKMWEFFCNWRIKSKKVTKIRKKFQISGPNLNTYKEMCILTGFSHFLKTRDTGRLSRGKSMRIPKVRFLFHLIRISLGHLLRQVLQAEGAMLKERVLSERGRIFPDYGGLRRCKSLQLAVIGDFGAFSWFDDIFRSCDEFRRFWASSLVACVLWDR